MQCNYRLNLALVQRREKCDERWAWELLLPLTSRGPVLFPGPERWKQAILPTLERCPGCEVPKEHYHPVLDEPKEGE